MCSCTADPRTTRSFEVLATLQTMLVTMLCMLLFQSRLLGFIALFFAASAAAQTVTVQAGDTLYGLAERYGTTVTDFQQVNPSLRSVIRPGDVLTLPAAASYTVQAGDDLGEIARRHGLTLETLLAVNGLPSTTVNPGTVLVLSSGGSFEMRKTYKVLEGDTLYTIALAFDISVEDLIAINDLEGSVIHPGQVLAVSGAPPKTPSGPLVITLEPGDTLWDIARTHDLSAAEVAAANGLSLSTPLRVGASLTVPGHFPPDSRDLGGAALETITVQPGDSLGTLAQRANTTVAALKAANNLSSDLIFAGQTLRFIPAEELAPATSAPSLGGRLQWPLKGVITSRFGYRRLRVNGSNFHNAIDIDGVTGDPVTAAAPGVVAFSGWQGSYGNLVIIRSEEVEYRYAHNSEVLVSAGETVKEGDTIARVGNTGLSFGDHLHFEVRVGGRPIDPLPMLEAN